ncbi:MAG: hydrogenase expression/formation protein HypE, partial [Nitrospirae bacterium GWC2_42_7]
MDKILLGHGSGGRLMHNLITDYFAPAFDMKTLNDSAVIENQFKGRIAITTDSYVVSPLFFPGGDIGSLSMCGTINDLSVSGARPLYLTAGFIIEEGFPLDDLRKILASMKAVSEKTGVKIIAGDTKVVDRGKCDGIFINTAGFGVVEDGVDISPLNVRPGQKIILSGSIGNHGISVIAKRNGISFDPPIYSDVRPLNSLAELMLSKTKKISVMRDPTRGGLATTLKEIANDSGFCIIIDEASVKVEPGILGACELLGLDPLYIANEGILVAVVDSEDAERLVDAMKQTGEGVEASIVGEIKDEPQKGVLLKTIAGG